METEQKGREEVVKCFSCSQAPTTTRAAVTTTPVSERNLKERTQKVTPSFHKAPTTTTPVPRTTTPVCLTKKKCQQLTSFTSSILGSFYNDTSTDNIDSGAEETRRMLMHFTFCSGILRNTLHNTTVLATPSGPIVRPIEINGNFEIRRNASSVFVIEWPVLVNSSRPVLNVTSA